MLPAAARIVTALEVAAARISEWVDRNPRVAWTGAILLIMALATLEGLYWPLHGYPGAMWHNNPPGHEIEVIHAVAPTVGWRELLGYWSGRTIHGHLYWQPLTGLLFWLQYQLFGRDNGRWCWVNIAGHVLLMGVLVWAVSTWVTGPLSRRLATGALAGVLLSLPTDTNRQVEFWCLGWWPSQPDVYALLFSVPLLAATALYVRTGDRKWALLAPITFFLAVCFKEIAYVAGLGACLMLLRHPRRWTLLGVLAAEGLTLFIYRGICLHTFGAYGDGNDPHRLLREVWAWQQTAPGIVLRLGPPLVLAALAVAVGYFTRHRLKLLDRVVIGLVLYVALGTAWLGLPTQATFQSSTWGLIGLAGLVALLFGILRSCRSWPIPELWVIFFISKALSICFPPVYGWHEYWPNVFGQSLIAIGALSLLDWIYLRIRAKWGAGTCLQAEQQQVGVPDAG